MTSPHISEHPLFPPELPSSPQDHDCSTPANCHNAAARWLSNPDIPIPPHCICPSLAAILTPWRRHLQSHPTFKRLPKLAAIISRTAGTPRQAVRRHLVAVSRTFTVHLPAWLNTAGLNAQANAIARHQFSLSPYPGHPNQPSFLDLMEDINNTLLHLAAQAPQHQLEYLPAARNATNLAGTTASALDPTGTPKLWPARDLLANLASRTATQAALLAPRQPADTQLRLAILLLQRNTLSTLRRMATTL